MKYIITLLAIFVLSNLGLCQEPELKSTKAKAAVRDYERKIEDVDEDFEKQLKNLEKSYQMKSEILRARLLSNLNAAMEEEAKRVRLEEATEIKELIKQRKETELPTLDELVARTKQKTQKGKVAKAKIPKTAVKFRGHRYFLVTTPVTWQMATIKSAEVGGHLVRINSLEEHDFLIDFIARTGFEGTNIAIDGTKRLDGETWLFGDEKQIDFRQMHHEPFDAPKSDAYLLLHRPMGYFANDMGCLQKQAFIIEWDK
jgi:hypothetical protein